MIKNPLGMGLKREWKPQRKTIKKLVIQSKNITPKQWSILVLELNLMRKAWKPYAKVEIIGSGVKKIVKNGTRPYKI